MTAAPSPGWSRSPAEPIRGTSEKWGALKGSLLNASSGAGTIRVVPHETVNGQAQGGACALPLSTLPTGVVRPRSHPTDGRLPRCGMYAGAGGIESTSTDVLNAASAADPEHDGVEIWCSKRTTNSGP